MAKTTKTRARKTQTAQAVDAQIKSETINDPVTGAEVHPDDVRPWSFNTLKAKLMGFELSEGQRSVLSWIGAILTYGATYYVGMSVTLWLANLALVFTGSVFLTFMIWFVGYVVSVVMAFYASLQAKVAIKNFSAEGMIESMNAAPGKIAGWFGRVRTAAQAV